MLLPRLGVLVCLGALRFASAANTRTQTLSLSSTQSVTATSSSTASQTLTSSVTGSLSATASETVTLTLPSATGTATESATVTLTLPTSTASVSASLTASRSETLSQTETLTLPTATASATLSVTSSASLTASESLTQTASETSSATLSASLSHTLSLTETLSSSLVAHSNYTAAMEPLGFVSGQEVRVRVAAVFDSTEVRRFNRSDEEGQVQLRVYLHDATHGSVCDRYVAAAAPPHYATGRSGVAPEDDAAAAGVDWVPSVYFTFAAPHASRRFLLCFRHEMPQDWSVEGLRGWHVLHVNTYADGRGAAGLADPSFLGVPVTSRTVHRAETGRMWYHLPEATSLQYAVIEVVSLERWNFTYPSSSLCTPARPDGPGAARGRMSSAHCGAGDTVKLVPRGVSCTAERTFWDAADYYGSRYVDGGSGAWEPAAADGFREGSTAGGVGLLGTREANPLVDAWAAAGVYPPVRHHANYTDGELRTAYVYVRLPPRTSSANHFDVCYSAREQRASVAGRNESLRSLPVWRKLFPCRHTAEDAALCAAEDAADTSFEVLDEHVGWSAFDLTPETWGAVAVDDGGRGMLSTHPAYNVSLSGGSAYRYDGGSASYWSSGDGGDYVRLVPRHLASEGTERRVTDGAVLGSPPLPGCWDTSLDDATGEGSGTATSVTTPGRGHGGFANEGAEYASASLDLRGDPAAAFGAAAAASVATSQRDNLGFQKAAFATLWLPKAKSEWVVCYRVACSYGEDDFAAAGITRGHARRCRRHTGVRSLPWHGGGGGSPPVRWRHAATIGVSPDSAAAARRGGTLRPEAFLEAAVYSGEAAALEAERRRRQTDENVRALQEGRPARRVAAGTSRYPPQSVSWYMNDTRAHTHGPLLLETRNATAGESGALDSRPWTYPAGLSRVEDAVGSALRLVPRGTACEHDAGRAAPPTPEDGNATLLQYTARLRPTLEATDGGAVECDSLSSSFDHAYCMGSAADSAVTSSVAFYLRLPEGGEYKVCLRAKGWNWAEVPPAVGAAGWPAAPGSANANENARRRGQWATGAAGTLFSEPQAEAAAAAAAAGVVRATPLFFVGVPEFLRISGDALDTLSLRTEETRENAEALFLVADVGGRLSAGARSVCRNGCVASADVLRLVPEGAPCDVNPRNYAARNIDEHVSLYCRADRTNVTADVPGVLDPAQRCLDEIARVTPLREQRAGAASVVAAVAAQASRHYDDVVPYDAEAADLRGVAAAVTLPAYLPGGANVYSVCYKQAWTWSWAVFNETVEVRALERPRVRMAAPVQRGEAGYAPLVGGLRTVFSAANYAEEDLVHFSAKLVLLRGRDNDNCLGYGEGTESAPVESTRSAAFDNATGLLVFTLTTPSEAGRYLLCVQVGRMGFYVPRSPAADYTYDVVSNGLHWWVSGAPVNQGSVDLQLEFTESSFDTDAAASGNAVKLTHPWASCEGGASAMERPIAVPDNLRLVRRAAVALELPAADDNAPATYKICVRLATGVPGSSVEGQTLWFEASQDPASLTDPVAAGRVRLRGPGGLSAFVTAPCPLAYWGLSPLPETGRELVAGMLTAPFVSEFEVARPALYMKAEPGAEQPPDVASDARAVAIKMVRAEQATCAGGAAQPAAVQLGPDATLYVTTHAPARAGRHRLCVRYAAGPWFFVTRDADGGSGANATDFAVQPSHLSAAVDADGGVVQLYDLRTAAATGASAASWCPSSPQAAASASAAAAANSTPAATPAPASPCLHHGYTTDLLQIRGRDELCTLPVSSPLGTLRGPPDYYPVDAVPGLAELARVRGVVLPPVGPAPQPEAFRLCLFKLRPPPPEGAAAGGGLLAMPRGMYHVPLYGEGGGEYWSPADEGGGVGPPSLRVTALFDATQRLPSGFAAAYEVEVVGGGAGVDGAMVQVMRCLDPFCAAYVPHDYAYNSQPPGPDGVRQIEDEILLFNAASNCTAPDKARRFLTPPTGLTQRVAGARATFHLVPKSVCLGVHPTCGVRFQMPSDPLRPAGPVVVSAPAFFTPEVAPTGLLRINGKIVEGNHRPETACTHAGIATCTRVVCLDAEPCTVEVQPTLAGADVYSTVTDLYLRCGVRQSAAGAAQERDVYVDRLFDRRTFAENQNLQYKFNLTTGLRWTVVLYLNESVDVALLAAGRVTTPSGEPIQPLLFCDAAFNGNATSARIELLLRPSQPAAFSVVALRPATSADADAPALPLAPSTLRPVDGRGGPLPLLRRRLELGAAELLHARAWYALRVRAYTELGRPLNLSNPAVAAADGRRNARLLVRAAVVGASGADNPVAVRLSAGNEEVQFMLDNARGCGRAAGGCDIAFEWRHAVGDAAAAAPVASVVVRARVRVVGRSLRAEAAGELEVANSRGVPLLVEAGEPCGVGCWHADEYHPGHVFFALQAPHSDDGVLAAEGPMAAETEGGRFRLVTSRDDPVRVGARTLHPFAWSGGRWAAAVTLHGSAVCTGCGASVHSTDGATLVATVTGGGRVVDGAVVPFSLAEAENELACAVVGGELVVTAVNAATGADAVYPRWALTIASSLNATYAAALGHGGVARLPAAEEGETYTVATAPLPHYAAMPASLVDAPPPEAAAPMVYTCTATAAANETVAEDPYRRHALAAEGLEAVALGVPASYADAAASFGLSGYAYEVPATRIEEGVTLYVSFNGEPVTGVDGQPPIFLRTVATANGTKPYDEALWGGPTYVQQAGDAGAAATLALNSTFEAAERGGLRYGSIVLTATQVTDVKTASVLRLRAEAAGGGGGPPVVRAAVFMVCSKEKRNEAADVVVLDEHCTKVNLTVSAPQHEMGVAILSAPPAAADGVTLRPGGTACYDNPTEAVIEAAAYFYVEAANRTLARYFAYAHDVEFTLSLAGQSFEDRSGSSAVPLLTAVVQIPRRSDASPVAVFRVTGLFPTLVAEPFVVSARLVGDALPTPPPAITSGSTAEHHRWSRTGEVFARFRLLDAVPAAGCTPPLPEPAVHSHYAARTPRRSEGWAYASGGAVGQGVPFAVEVATPNLTRAWGYPTGVLVRVEALPAEGCGGTAPVRAYSVDAATGVVVEGAVVPLVRGGAVVWVEFAAPCEACRLQFTLCYTTATGPDDCLTPPRAPTPADAAPPLASRVVRTAPFVVAAPAATVLAVVSQVVPGGGGGGGRDRTVSVADPFTVKTRAFQLFGAGGYAAASPGAVADVEVVNRWVGGGGGGGAGGDDVSHVTYGNGGFVRGRGPLDAGERCGGALRESFGGYGAVRAEDPTLTFVYTRPCSRCEVWVYYRLCVTEPTAEGLRVALPPDSVWQSFPLLLGGGGGGGGSSVLSMRVVTCGTAWALAPSSPRARRRGAPFTVAVYRVDAGGHVAADSGGGGGSSDVLFVAEAREGGGNGGGLPVRVQAPRVVPAAQGQGAGGSGAAGRPQPSLLRAEGVGFAVAATAEAACAYCALDFRLAASVGGAAASAAASYPFAVATPPTFLKATPTTDTQHVKGLVQRHAFPPDSESVRRSWDLYVYAADGQLARSVAPLGGPVEAEMKAAYAAAATEGVEVVLRDTAAQDVPAALGYYETASNDTDYHAVHVQPMRYGVPPSDLPLVMWNGLLLPMGRAAAAAAGGAGDVAVRLETAPDTPLGIATVQFEVVGGGGTVLPTWLAPGRPVTIGVQDAAQRTVYVAAAAGVEGVAFASGQEYGLDIVLVSARNERHHRADGAGTLSTSLECGGVNGTACAESVKTAPAAVVDGRGRIVLRSEPQGAVGYDCACVLAVRYAPEPAAPTGEEGAGAGGGNETAGADEDAPPPQQQQQQQEPGPLLHNDGEIDVPVYITSSDSLNWRWVPYLDGLREEGVTYAVELTLHDAAGTRRTPHVATGPDNRVVALSEPQDCFVCSGGALQTIGENVCAPLTLPTGAVVFRGFFALPNATAHPSDLCVLTGFRGVAGRFPSFRNRVARAPETAAPDAAGAVPAPAPPPPAVAVVRIVPQRPAGAGRAASGVFGGAALEAGFRVGGETAEVGRDVTLAFVPGAAAAALMPLYLDCGFGGGGRGWNYSRASTGDEAWLAVAAETADPMRTLTLSLRVPAAGVWGCVLKRRVYRDDAAWRAAVRAGRSLAGLVFDYAAVATSRALPLLTTLPAPRRIEADVFDYDRAGWRPLDGSRWMSGYALLVRLRVYDAAGAPFVSFEGSTSTVVVRSDGVPCLREQSAAFRRSCMVFGGREYGTGCGSAAGGGGGGAAPAYNTSRAGCEDPFWGARTVRLPESRLSVARLPPAGSGAAPEFAVVPGAAGEDGPTVVPGLGLVADMAPGGMLRRVLAGDGDDDGGGGGGGGAVLRVVHGSRDLAVSGLVAACAPAEPRVFGVALQRAASIHIECAGCGDAATQEKDLVRFAGLLDGGNETSVGSPAAAALVADASIGVLVGGKGVAPFDVEVVLRSGRSSGGTVVTHDSVSTVLVRGVCYGAAAPTPAPTAASKFLTPPPAQDGAAAAAPLPLWVTRSLFGSAALKVVDLSRDGWYRVKMTEGRGTLHNVSFGAGCYRGLLEARCALPGYDGYNIDVLGSCGGAGGLRGVMAAEFQLSPEAATPAPPITLAPNEAANTPVASLNLTLDAARGESFDTFAPAEFEAKLTAELAMRLQPGPTEALYARVLTLCRLLPEYRGWFDEAALTNVSVCRIFGVNARRRGGWALQQQQQQQGEPLQMRFRVVTFAFSLSEVQAALGDVVASEGSSVRLRYPGIDPASLNITEVPLTPPPTASPPTDAPATSSPFLPKPPDNATATPLPQPPFFSGAASVCANGFGVVAAVVVLLLLC